MGQELQITTEQFLEDLYGSAESIIYFNVNGKTWKNKPQTYAKAQSKLKYLNITKDADIYFIPNTGGTKNSQITQINSSFIDWDAGRNSQGNYFPIEIVAQKKQEFLQQIDIFPYRPTYVIETRNGYHVYWFLYPGTTPEQFIIIQKELIKQLNSDPVIHNPARVMRLPGYYACKSGQYSPFFVNIIEHNNVKYPVDIFISHFSLSLSLQKNNDNSQIVPTSQLPTESTISAHNNTYIKKNKEYTRSIIMGTKPQTSDNEKEIILKTMDEVIDYICRQNIAEYLKLDNYRNISSEGSLSVSCPCHNDTIPSASIYYHEDYCYLKCHSSNCKFGSGTLVKVVEMKNGITEGDAVIKLMEYYNLQIDDSWMKEEENKYIENIKIISQCKQWKELYPDLYRCINRIKADLSSKILLAKDKIQLRTSKGKSLFFCSLREFERVYRQKTYLENQNRQNERVDRYCLLGLMEKIDENEIPYGLYRRMQVAKGKKRFQYRIQCYHIPEYTTEFLRKADEIAHVAKEKGIKLNSITKNSVRDVFGEDMARKLYPQTDDIKPSGSGAEFLTAVEKVLLDDISLKGYTTTSTVKDRLCGTSTWKQVHDRRVKEHLPGLLEKHKLVEITANKKLKEKYKIDSKGYPKIIMLEQDYNNMKALTENSSDALRLKEIVAA